MQTSINSFFLKPRVSFYFLFDSLNVEIETERLFIHSYRENDFENCLTLYGDEGLTKYFDHGKARKKYEIEELVLKKGSKYFIEGKPFGLFSIFCKKGMAFIGQIDLLPAEEAGSAEIGFILHEQYQNQGFCTEAVEAFLFEYMEELNFRGPRCVELPINKVIATVHPLNQPSKRILQKVGMTFDKIQERFGNPRLWYSMPTTFAAKSQKIGIP